MNILLKSNILNNSFNKIEDFYSNNTFFDGFENEWGVNELINFHSHKDEKLIIPVCNVKPCNKYNFMNLTDTSIKISESGFYQINILKEHFIENGILNNLEKNITFYVSPDQKSLLTMKELSRNLHDNFHGEIIIHPLCFVESYGYIHNNIISTKKLNIYKLEKKYSEFDFKHVFDYCKEYELKYGKWWEDQISIKDKLKFFKNMIKTNNLYSESDYIFVISDSMFLKKLFNWSYFSECEYRIFNINFERFKTQNIFNVNKIKKIDNNDPEQPIIYKIYVEICGKKITTKKEIEDIRTNVHKIVKNNLSYNYRKLFPVKFPPKGYSKYYWRNLYLWFEYLGKSFLKENTYSKTVIKNILFYFINGCDEQ